MNYEQLAIDDPGGTIDSALITLKAMTETKTHTQPHRITSRDIYNALGSVNGETVLQALETAAINNPVMARVLKWIEPGPDQGVDIIDPEVQYALGTLVGGDVTQQMIDDIISNLSTYTDIKYPGLKHGDVRHARGEI